MAETHLLFYWVNFTPWLCNIRIHTNCRRLANSYIITESTTNLRGLAVGDLRCSSSGIPGLMDDGRGSNRPSWPKLLQEPLLLRWVETHVLCHILIVVTLIFLIFFLDLSLFLLIQLHLIL